MLYRISWLTPYRPGRVSPIIRGLRLYTEPEARAQVVKFKRHWPGNRYYLEPVKG